MNMRTAFIIFIGFILGFFIDEVIDWIKRKIKW